MTNQHHMPLLTDYTPFKIQIRILVLRGSLNVLIFLKYPYEYFYITAHEYLSCAVDNLQ